MIAKVETADLLSRITNVRHGFSTRVCGDLLCRDNHPAFTEACGLPNCEIALLSQVHGNTIVEAEPNVVPEADGAFTTSPGVAVAVRTADCAPVLIAHVEDDRANMVAAVHAGWRGAVAGIVGVAIDRLVGRGALQDSLRFAIGPTIGVGAFEVGDEVIEAARASLGEDPPMIMRAKPHLDLRGLILKQLEQKGVPPAHVELTGGCTASDATRYFSYRRDDGRNGRHLSLIAFTDG